MKRVLLAVLAIATITINAQQPAKAKAKPADDFKEYKAYVAKPSSETFNKAIEVYQKKVDANPKDYQSATMIANICKAEMNRIIRFLDKNIDSLKPQQKFGLGNLYLGLGQYDKSIEIYSKINAKMPKWSCPWRHKGEAYMEKGDLAEAEKCLNKSIETNVNHYDAYLMLAEVQKKGGRYEEALKTFNKGLEVKFKGSEDPEKEVAPIDEEFLHLELLKLNKQDNTDTYKKLYNHLKEKAADDSRWSNIK